MAKFLPEESQITVERDTGLITISPPLGPVSPAYAIAFAEDILSVAKDVETSLQIF